MTVELKTPGMSLALEILASFGKRHPEFSESEQDLHKAFKVLVECFSHRGTLYICGNGGSWADSVHISGELVKTFERQRPLPESELQTLRDDPNSIDLADVLQDGFRAVPLGLSGSLVSAIWNDCEPPNIHYAQELYVMADPGDLLLAISTSGCAKNVLGAMAVARLKGMQSIALTGPDGGDIARLAEIALRMPGQSTSRIQEAHLPVYHVLCQAVEAAFYPEKRK